MIDHKDIDFNSNNLKEEMYKELSSILAYWRNNAYDLDFDGFLGERDFNNQVVPNAEKGVVLNARILWTFSAAYNFTKNEDYLQSAHRAYDYLIDHFWDHHNGGFFWAVDYKGSVSSSRKQIYAQGFGIYGLSEYYKASKNNHALVYATKLFELIEKHSFDKKHSGYIEALDEKWNVLADMRLSDKDANEPKSMNTHLHILEPYTNLYSVWKSKVLEEKIRNLIQVFKNHIINSNTLHFELFFKKDWTVKSNTISYGHDIEGAWLLAEAATVIGDTQLIQEINKLCVKMVDVCLEEGINADGSVNNEREPQHLDDDKHWWPQAEAMVGLVYSWKITKDQKYLKHLKNTWSFIKKHIIDYENGEWFWRVDSKGTAYTEDVKLGFWKCPYHNSRALMEVIKNL
jgi:mannobiose 2-epimerase